MMWITFGDTLNTVNYQGEPTQKTKYSLHVQCPWRIKNAQQQIILAAQDIFAPSSSIPWTEAFDWDVQGNNLFDEKAEKWLRDNEGIAIVSCVLSPGSDLALTFSNDDVLEIFVATSTDDECWRLLEYGDRHFVATGSGILEQ
jgi:hypothetical protein